MWPRLFLPSAKVFHHKIRSIPDIRLEPKNTAPVDIASSNCQEYCHHWKMRE